MADINRSLKKLLETINSNSNDLRVHGIQPAKMKPTLILVFTSITRIDTVRDFKKDVKRRRMSSGMDNSQSHTETDDHKSVE